MTRVPFLDLAAAHAEIRAELDDAWRRVVDGGRFVLGHEVERFEDEFADYCGARHCVTVGNGLDALTLILRAAGVEAGDEVIVPAQTFVATWLAVSAVGARPVPVDIDDATSNIDPALVEPALSERTRAVVAVHLYGRPAAMERLREIASRRALLLVEDAAQAHGASLGGRRAGALGDAAAFSFYPGKNLGALGDGGAVVTSDAALADRVRLLRNYGSPRKYEHDEAGVNSRLDELQAALLSVKLARLDDWNRRRCELAATYAARLSGTPGLQLPASDSDELRSAWHLFTVRHENREALRAALADDGIETLVHYPSPPFLTGAYRNHAGLEATLPVAARHARTTFSLPFGPHLASADLETVCRDLAAVSGRLASEPTP